MANVQGRYERDVREAFDDGWAHAPGEGSAEEFPRALSESDSLRGSTPDPGVASDLDKLPPLKTTVTEERAKTILNRNHSPDISFKVSLNPYRGCEHGCIYCFARPTHSYLGLSPGLDFESRLFAKVNAVELLRRELAAPNYQPQVIALGINTDAYQPIERKLKITRGLIEVLHETSHPFSLLTKSSLIERDVDLLADLARKRLVRAAVTITTLDPGIARKLEPRAASPARRLRVVRTLAEAGIPMSVNVSPIIPFITDGEMERILEQAALAGAGHAHTIVLRLPWELNEVFQQWLQAHFPLRAERVMNRVREIHGREHGGEKVYDSRFGKRMTGEGVWADLFRQRFERACRALGLNQNAQPPYDLSLFTKPNVPKVGEMSLKDSPQLDLFG